MMPGRFCATFQAGNTNGWMLWHYQTSDGPVEVLRPRYFDDMASAGRAWRLDRRQHDAGRRARISAMLLIVQSASMTKGVTVDKLGFQPTAFLSQPALSDAELEAVIADEELAGMRK